MVQSTNSNCNFQLSCIEHRALELDLQMELLQNVSRVQQQQREQLQQQQQQKQQLQQKLQAGQTARAKAGEPPLALNMNMNTAYTTGGGGDFDGGYSSDGSSGSNGSQGSNYTDASEIDALRARTEALEEGERVLAMGVLQRVSDRTGIPKASHITATSDIASIRAESDRIENEVSVRRSIKFQRRALLTMSSGVEYLHNKSPLLKGRLTGWGECMLDSIDDYDVVFRRLHEKHGPRIKNGRPSKEMEPEMELLYMVAYNAFTFTVSQSIANLTAGVAAPLSGPGPHQAGEVEQAHMSMMQARMKDAKQDSDRLRMFTAEPAAASKSTTSTTKKGERVMQL
jgi:hypothetical protein